LQLSETATDVVAHRFNVSFVERGAAPSWGRLAFVAASDSILGLMAAWLPLVKGEFGHRAALGGLGLAWGGVGRPFTMSVWLT
jgi:hypothetical protein